MSFQWQVTVWSLYIIILMIISGCSLGLDTESSNFNQNKEKTSSSISLDDFSLATHKESVDEFMVNTDLLDMSTEIVIDLTGGTSTIPDMFICGNGQQTLQERCDGIDNDCDEEIDEDYDELGMTCLAGIGACAREGSFECSMQGVDSVCNVIVGTPEMEICDLLDNDCDGAVDEGVSGCCQSGDEKPCGMEVGACTVAMQVCSELGEWSQCDAVLPIDEVCDEVDNDCDGSTDEGIRNACGQCGAVPQEVCDGADNDCDGNIDEAVRNACGQCGAVPQEVCDGNDNDCDGSIDEAVLNPCGQCGAVSQEVCDGNDNDCDGSMDEGVRNACGQCGPVPQEICDGADNDCDGNTDEALPARMTCVVGVGACRRQGMEVCQAGGWSCNVSAGAAQSESCDGVDNDCDGSTDEGNLCVEVCDGSDNDNDGSVDEGVLNVCGQCGTVPVEQCDGSDNDCDGSTDEGVRNVCNQCGPVPAELCDGDDNDCDGNIDEGVLNACGQCGPVPAEECNQADDDCDGNADEGFDLGAACSTGLGECRREGIWICTPQNGLLCFSSQPITQPSSEECDGLDNDCDGSVDEGFNLQTNINHCGACNHSCVIRANVCMGGQCRCGDVGACRLNQICVPSGNSAICQDVCNPQCF